MNALPNDGRGRSYRSSIGGSASGSFQNSIRSEDGGAVGSRTARGNHHPSDSSVMSNIPIVNSTSFPMVDGEAAETSTLISQDPSLGTANSGASRPFLHASEHLARGNDPSARRQKRNQREKERSARISQQIDALKKLLAEGGVLIPGGTKHVVLQEAISYIRRLQARQVQQQWEMDQLQHQMGNLRARQTVSSCDDEVSPLDYKLIFANSTVGMALATLGGQIFSANHAFCFLSGLPRESLCSNTMTLFQLAHGEDLQYLFEKLTQTLVQPPKSGPSYRCLVRGSSVAGLGLAISVVVDGAQSKKCFCATLIQNPQLPLETAVPIPVTSRTRYQGQVNAGIEAYAQVTG